MKKRNRCFASTIAFFMLAGLLPKNVQADLKDNTMLTAVELEGTSLLDELEGNINEVKGQALYGDDEFVTAIVELEGAPVMDYYNSSSYFSLDEENSAGESVSKFLASDDVKEVSHGFECGIQIEDFNDVKEGDILEAYTMERVK